MVPLVHSLKCSLHNSYSLANAFHIVLLLNSLNAGYELIALECAQLRNVCVILSMKFTKLHKYYPVVENSCGRIITFLNFQILAFTCLQHVFPAAPFIATDEIKRLGFPSKPPII